MYTRAVKKAETRWKQAFELINELNNQLKMKGVPLEDRATAVRALVNNDYGRELCKTLHGSSKRTVKIGVNRQKGQLGGAEYGK